MTIVAVLLALGLFIVLMQLGLMALVRRLAQQLEIERSRIDKLERAASRRDAGSPDPATTTGFVPTRPVPQPAPARVEPAPAPAPRASAAAQQPAALAAPAAAATLAGLAAAEQLVAEPDTQARVDPGELRAEMLGLMRQLVRQGLSVRDIAARCGLSEAEAELMLSLPGGSDA